jgi:hypothetical protein
MGFKVAANGSRLGEVRVIAFLHAGTDVENCLKVQDKIFAH